MSSLSDLITLKENMPASKGWGLPFAIMIGSAFVFGSTELIKLGWPTVLKLMDQYGIEPWQFYIYGLVLWHYGCLTVHYSLMWLVYHLRSPFFERYKILKD